MSEVLIAVQARSTSTRLPKKTLQLIDTKTMAEHVLAACRSSAYHINKTVFKNAINCKIALLIPFNDKLKEAFPDEYIIEEDEFDVLARYVKAVREFQSDYVVRITSDCPLSSPALITKHIMCAVKNDLDYCSNVFDGCRTFIDGLDVEVISRALLTWLNNCAKDVYDREHVTTYFRKYPPPWARIGSIIGHIDLSDVKLSVDTPEELDKVRENYKSVLDKVTRAKKLGHTVYRF
jgi:spore coat polysaccharide biosynthesis protein SpsF